MPTVQLEEGCLDGLSGSRGLGQGPVCGVCLACHQLQGLLEASAHLQQQEQGRG
jgi:hypothetical protein